VKIHNCAQLSEEWHQLRLGIPTSSQFHRIVTPAGKLSSQADEFLNRLLAEWMLGAPCEEVETKWMQHGHEYEEQAAAAFQFATELDTEPIGFITTDDRLIGSSPDRVVVGGKRGVELKCPSPQVHVGYMRTRKIADKYKPQVQGQLLVCEFESGFLQSYCPPLPTVIVETARDEKYLVLLEAALRDFVDRMLEARADLEQRFGPFKRPEPKPEGKPWITEEDIRRAFPGMNYSDNQTDERGWDPAAMQ
jgi:hypothetical protein